MLGKTYLFCLKNQPDTIVSAFSLSNDSIRLTNRITDEYKEQFLEDTDLRDKALNRPETLHYYEKNGFRYLIADERLEAKYMGIGVGRLPLNTRLMYFDLLKIKVNEE